MSQELLTWVAQAGAVDMSQELLICHRGMGTGVQGGKQVSSYTYFRQGNSDKDTIKVYALCLSKPHH